MAMPLPVPEDTLSGEPDDREGATVEETFELFSAQAPKGWRVELIEEEIIDSATAAMTIAEYQAEIETLTRLERMAAALRRRHVEAAPP